MSEREWPKDEVVPGLEEVIPEVKHREKPLPPGVMQRIIDDLNKSELPEGVVHEDRPDAEDIDDVINRHRRN